VSKLDLILINPGNHREVYGELGSSLSALEPPIWAASLAAFIRERGYTVKILDAEVEGLGPSAIADTVADANPLLASVVVLGSNPSAASTPKMTAAGKIVQELKKRNIETKSVLCGLHPSAVPERTLKEEAADFVCQGEGFETHVALLETLKNKSKMKFGDVPGLWYREGSQLVSTPLASLVELDELPMAAWDLLPMHKYRAHNWHCFVHLDQRQPYAVIFTSLGCPYNCSYCNISALYNGKPGIRYKSPQKVVEEIDYLVTNYGVKNIKILDELFALREDRVIAISDLIIEAGYDLNIWAYARVDTITTKMLEKMKQAGINWLAYGIESGSKKVRTGVTKRFEQDVVRKAITMTQSAGINIMGNFIFGLPDDDLHTMQETLEFAKDLNCEYINFYTAMAYPGSQLYEDSIKQGVPLPESWQGYGQYSEDTLPLPTKYLSAAEVLSFRDSAFKEYLTDPKYTDLIARKFGINVAKHVNEMLKHDIMRKIHVQ